MTKRYTPDPRNARLHPDRNRALIRQSLAEIGGGRSILIDGNDTIVAGNGVHAEALALGLTIREVIAQPNELIAVKRPDLVGDASIRAALLDNAASDTSTWDMEALRQLDAESPALLAGLDEVRADLEAALTATLHEPGGGGDEFDPTPDNAGETRCKTGDLWIIGGVHRLLIGDSTDPTAVARLMGGERAQGCFTSPPYAEQRKDHYTSVASDSYRAWFWPIQHTIRQSLQANGSFFLNIKEHSENFRRSVYVHDLVVHLVNTAGWVYLDEFCWERSGIPGDPHKMGKFKNQWEPVFWFAQTERPLFLPENVMKESNDAFVGTNEQYSASLKQYQGVKSMFGSRKLGNGFVYPGNRLPTGQGERDNPHPASLPTSLPSFFMQAFSEPSDLWLDLFLGSGTTLIAAHRTGRRCYGVEIEPRYGDIVLKRAEAEGLSVTLHP